MTCVFHLLLLSEGLTHCKMHCECNQCGRRVVFDPELVAMSTTFVRRAVGVECLVQRKRVVVVSAALRHESHSPRASQNSSKKLWQSRQSKLC